MRKVFEQAQQDVMSTRLVTSESVSYIKKGIKIESKGGEIKIYNTKFGGDFYKELTKEQYELFSLNGWKVGCYMMAISNYKVSLQRISNNIVKEINSRKNQRHYVTLKEHRSYVMDKLTDTLKLLHKETKNG